MNSEQKLFILLLDDTKEVLDNLKANVQHFVDMGELNTFIEVTTVHIQTEKNETDSSYKIKNETIIDIANICSKKFDYIISDFAFIGDKEENEKLRLQLIDQNREVCKSDLKAGTVLQCCDIKSNFEVMKNSFIINKKLINNFEQNFLGHKGDIIIYTYSPSPFSKYFKSTQKIIRINEIQEVFEESASQPRFILMHDEFEIPSIIINTLKPHNNDLKTYLSTLLSNRLGNELHILALMRMAYFQHKLRFKNTRWAFHKITSLGVGIGTGVALIGETTYLLIENLIHLVLKPEFEFMELFLYLSAIILLLIISFSVIAWIGVTFAKLTEKWVADLVGYKDNI